MVIYVRGPHNGMIKPYENGEFASVIDFGTQKVLISDTTLRSFIIPQVRKMTPKLRHIRGCELCIIPKDMKVDLNRPGTRLVTGLKHKSVGRHILNSLFITTSDANYKDKVFQMLNVYMLLSKILLSASPVFLLNQRILFI